MRVNTRDRLIIIDHISSKQLEWLTSVLAWVKSNSTQLVLSSLDHKKVRINLHCAFNDNWLHFRLIMYDIHVHNSTDRGRDSFPKKIIHSIGVDVDVIN